MAVFPTFRSCIREVLLRSLNHSFVFAATVLHPRGTLSFAESFVVFAATVLTSQGKGVGFSAVIRV